MKITQLTVEERDKQASRVPEPSAALSTGIFHPIGGLDPDMSRSPRVSNPRIGFWSRLRATRS